MRKAASAGMALLLSTVALSTSAAAADRTPGDPFGQFNRVIWGFNQGVDRIILKPVTQGYRAVVPKPARRGISHLFANLEEPFNAINALLQGKPKRALNSLGRFVINTTIGVGGLGDQATKMGLKPTPEDLGQTFAVWGIKSSAYLVLPILGPSTVRDGIGTIAAQYIDPYRVCLRECNFIPKHVPLAVTAIEIIDVRSQLIDAGADTFLATSADPYAVARSAYFQRREAEIADRDETDATAAPGAAATPGASGDAALDAALKDIDANQSSGPPRAGATAPVPLASPSAADPAAGNATSPVPGDVNPQQPAPGQTPTATTPQPQ